MNDTKPKPDCPDCGLNLVCPDCVDPRPIAGKVNVGWKLLTPLGRWETVTSAEQPSRFDPVLIKTQESGDLVWRYRRTDKVEARPAAFVPYGKPEIRVIEGDWRTGPIHAVACVDTEDVMIPTGAPVLAFGFKTKDEPGWTVHLGTTPTTEVVKVASKEAARTLVRGAGRRAARMLGVKFTICKPA